MTIDLSIFSMSVVEALTVLLQMAWHTKAGSRYLAPLVLAEKGPGWEV